MCRRRKWVCINYFLLIKHENTEACFLEHIIVQFALSFFTFGFLCNQLDDVNCIVYANEILTCPTLSNLYYTLISILIERGSFLAIYLLKQVYNFFKMSTTSNTKNWKSPPTISIHPTKLVKADLVLFLR